MRGILAAGHDVSLSRSDKIFQSLTPFLAVELTSKFPKCGGCRRELIEGLCRIFQGRADDGKSLIVESGGRQVHDLKERARATLHVIFAFTLEAYPSSVPPSKRVGSFHCPCRNQPAFSTAVRSHALSARKLFACRDPGRDLTSQGEDTCPDHHARAHSDRQQDGYAATGGTASIRCPEIRFGSRGC